MSSFKLRKDKNCLNCGETVEKHFCPECGQENIEVKEDAFHMVVHAVADYFHFEHKFFSTVRPLLFKPGQLTSAYVAGKRVSFIHPIRLYIFISIVFFLVVLGGKAERQESAKSAKETSDFTKLTPKQKDSVIAVRVKELDKDLKKSMKYVPVDSADRQELIDDIKKEVAKGGDGRVIKGWKTDGGKKFRGEWNSTDTTVAQYEKNQALLPKGKKDGFIKHYFVKRSLELNKYENPKQMFLEDLLHNIPKMMFFILPIFAMILKLVYIRKDRYYYEHLIYSFHVHSAFFLGFLIIKLCSWLFGFIYDITDWLTFFYLIYMTWYIYRSLRTFYGSKRWVTVLKMFFLFICYNFVLLLGFILILAVSFALV